MRDRLLVKTKVSQDGPEVTVGIPIFWIACDRTGEKGSGSLRVSAPLVRDSQGDERVDILRIELGDRQKMAFGFIETTHVRERHSEVIKRLRMVRAQEESSL